MENKDLPENYIDEKTRIEYRLVGDPKKCKTRKIWKNESKIFKRK